MKNLFKFNFLFIAFFLTAATFSSCSKDDDIPSGDKSKLIGEWSVTGIYKDGENIISEDWNEEGSYVEFNNSKEIFGAKHNGDGTFMANLNYEYDGSITTWFPFGSWKMTSSNVVRINNEYDLKIKTSTTTELIFEIEDDEMGWIEIRCVK